MFACVGLFIWLFVSRVMKKQLHLSADLDKGVDPGFLFLEDWGLGRKVSTPLSATLITVIKFIYRL